ncbi:ABC transporter ATP-binding protein [Amphibacillus cookii]|uniref:ABC transporter ATP-binding protein n=1 Tax=Amphibacillus cookii TaxID=767787 RepID=UPI00195C6060|nr:ATP-binding cassette domain-containing protein [Amphibacillus cookii]MBM7542332.1 ABC-2 type transport system ATP-binding protein [Amphibacillus cookii]
MVTNLVEVDQALKKFKDVTALNDVTISFEKGKIHGIIGRNGSGKTVLFKTICGFMKLDSGQILINGKKVKPSAAQDIGLIIEEPGFIGGLSGFKNLKLLASIKRKITDKEIKKTIEQVGLDPKSKQHVSKYSLGMRHRLAIAQAIMEKPELLILDEPMNGLDKYGVKEMRELFKRLNDHGMTLILSSHYAEDIEALCDTVAEMDNGNLEVLL